MEVVPQLQVVVVVEVVLEVVQGQFVVVVEQLLGPQVVVVLVAGSPVVVAGSAVVVGQAQVVVVQAAFEAELPAPGELEQPE